METDKKVFDAVEIVVITNGYKLRERRPLSPNYAAEEYIEYCFSDIESLAQFLYDRLKRPIEG